MKARLCFAIFAVIILAVFAIAVQVGAETMKLHRTTVLTKIEVLKVEDVPDHVIGLYEHTGGGYFETGEVASVMEKGTIDYIKGNGTSQGYTRLTFEDGSTIDTKFQNTTRAEPGGKGMRFEGTFTILQGTGRWAGIQGTGTHTGRRLVPVAAGFPGGTPIFIDLTLTYTLPGR